MSEPITLAEAKAHLRLSANDASEDAAITDAIVEARGWVEDYTGLVLTRRTVTEVIGAFGQPLRSWPIATIDVVIFSNVDGADNFLQYDSFYAQTASRPASMLPKAGTIWPSIFPGSSITVSLTAGFADAAAINDLSPNFMRAMKVLLTEFYENRGAPELSEHAEEVARRLCSATKVLML